MFTEIIALILGVSLANERLIEYLKTWWTWLGIKQQGSTEKIRKTTVQLITLITAILGSSALADGGFKISGMVIFSEGDKTIEFPVLIIAILSTSGSAFWSHILGYSKAIKDVRKEQVEIEKATKREKEISIRERTLSDQDALRIISSWDQPQNFDNPELRLS
jgi:hypothetical protein